MWGFGFSDSPLPAFVSWEQTLKQYIDRPIFVMEGINGGHYTTSREYARHFQNGTTTYLGRVKRASFPKCKEVLNQSFRRFCDAENLPLPTAYRMPAIGHLGSGSYLSAAFQSTAKYDRLQPVLDTNAWVLAGELTSTHFMDSMRGSSVLGQEECILEMNMNTSPGYPWSLKFSNKKDFLLCEKMSMVLSDYWVNLIEGDNLCPIWTSSLKMELRPVEKLQEDKLRTFTAAPFEHSVATNRLCLDMNIGFYNGAGETWSMVGSSKFMGGWNNLFNRLSKHPNAFELDETAYDSSLAFEFMDGQRQIREGMLKVKERTKENCLRLKKIYEAIIHSVIVMDNGELIQKHTGNPSGCSNTVVDNTMILYRLFAYAYIILARKVGIVPKYPHFHSHVEAALYGDDNTFTVSDEIVGWFNAKAISEIWSGIGVTTKTPDGKWEPKKLENVCFLSNGFYFDKEASKWYPKPETSKVLSSLCWGSDIDDVRWHLMRAYALRIDSFGNKEVAEIIERYIEFLRANYQRDFYGEVKQMKMIDIQHLWKSDLFLNALYSGHEGSQARKVTECFKRFCIRQENEFSTSAESIGCGFYDPLAPCIHSREGTTKYPECSRTSGYKHHASCTKRVHE